MTQEKKRAAAVQQVERERKKFLQEEKKKQLQEIFIDIGSGNYYLGNKDSFVLSFVL